MTQATNIITRDPEISKLSDKELKMRIREYDNLIYGRASCFGTGDLRYLAALVREKEDRRVKK